jgi:hypothetical protein
MRIGELEKAEFNLLSIFQSIKVKKFDWFAATCSNLTMLSIQLNRRKDSIIKYAREGVEVAAKVYLLSSHQVSTNIYIIKSFR